MDTLYLQQKRRRWYVQLRVPTHLVPIIGKRLLCRSLKTGDLAEAVRRKHAVLAQFHSLLQLAERKPPTSTSTFDREVAYGKLLLDKVQAGKMYSEDALEQYNKRLSEDTTEFLDANPDKWIDDLVNTRENRILQGLREAIEKVQQYTLLSEAIASYLDTDKDRIRPSTLQQRETRLTSFKDWHGDSGLNDITKADAGRYVSDVLEPRGLSTATLKHTVGDLSTFFNWCCGRGLCDNNPFDGVSRTIRTVKRGVRASGDELRPWTEDELTQLLSRAPQDSDIWIMAVLALYTGMRANELAETKCGDASVTHITIPEAKTKAGRRTVPVHPIIAPLVAHLVRTSTDGYLVAGLKPGGYDGKRNHMFAKRFSYHKRVKLKLPAALKFHGLRKNCATALYRAGVPVDRVEQLIGHTHGNLAQDVYINGAQPEQLQHDMRSISHGETIDGIVRAAIARLR